MLVGATSLVTGGLDAGVDFVGGRSYTVRFDQPMNPTEVSDELSKTFGSAIVKTYGADNQLKITTKHRIQETGVTVDTEVEKQLYTALTKYLPSGLTFDNFSKSFEGKTIGKMSYNKVGPTIADDIKRGALIAVIGSLIVVFLYLSLIHI